jgi:hypothetical protein
VLPLLNTYARIPVSELIAQYNGVGPGNGTDRLPATMREILSKSLTLRGFINSAADVEATLSPENSREYRKARPALMMMTMSEYEERFRPPAPSLHQTFAEVRGPNRGGRRSRRLWVTAALVGVMTITSKAALHHSSHADGSQVSRSGIQACDFIHR